MADPVVKFEPYMTAHEPGGSLILDRNLIEIKKALADANATFISIKNTLNTIVSSITVITGGTSTTPRVPPGLFDSLGDADDGGAFLLPGPRGQAGIPGQFTVGLQGDPGDDGDTLVHSPVTGMPLGAVATEFDTTGDVMRNPNGDSRIRGQDGIYTYSRVVVGPYGVNFGTLYIEDNAVLYVL